MLGADDHCLLWEHHILTSHATNLTYGWLRISQLLEICQQVESCLWKRVKDHICWQSLTISGFDLVKKLDSFSKKIEASNKVLKATFFQHLSYLLLLLQFLADHDHQFAFFYKVLGSWLKLVTYLPAVILIECVNLGGRDFSFFVHMILVWSELIGNHVKFNLS